jgi:hypothetical protein
MPKKSKANKRYRRNRGLKTFKYSSIYQKRKTRNHKYKNKNVRTMKKIYGGDDFLSKLKVAEKKDNKRNEKKAKEEANAAEKRARDEAKAAENRAKDEATAAKKAAKAAENRAKDEAKAAKKAAMAAEKAQMAAENKAIRISRIDDNFKAAKRSMREAIIEARKHAREKESAAVKIQNQVRGFFTKRAEAKAKKAEVEAQQQEYEQNYGTSSNTQPNEDTLNKIYRQAFPVLDYDPEKNIVTQRNRTAKASRSQKSMRRTK